MAITQFKGKYAFLSNMYPVVLRINGEMYPSAEHAFQAMKSLDQDTRINISLCRSPQEAKKAGRLISLRSDWESVKVDVMLEILKAKFNNSELAQQLRDTQSEELVEGNTWGDTFWGVCNGIGENNLGKLLMEVRKEIL